MNFRTHSPQINQLFDLATALLVKTGGKSPSSIFKIKFDVTRILNSDSWKDAVLDTIIIKGGDSNLKILILQVLKYSWFYYIIDQINYFAIKRQPLNVFKWQLRLKVFVRDTILPTNSFLFKKVMSDDKNLEDEELNSLISTYYYDFNQ